MSGKGHEGTLWGDRNALYLDEGLVTESFMRLLKVSTYILIAMASWGKGRRGGERSEKASMIHC